MVGPKGPPKPCRGWLKPGSDNKIAELAGAGLPLAVVNGAAPPHPLEAVGGFWVWGTSGRLFEGPDGVKAPDGGWGGATEVTEGSEGGKHQHRGSDAMGLQQRRTQKNRSFC